MSEAIDKLKERLRKPLNPIHMARVPKNTYDRFMELASEEDFCNDFGMALKFLVDFYFGIIPTGLEGVYSEIDALKAEIALLKEKKEEKPVRKRLDGRGIENGNIKQTPEQG